MGGNSGGGTPSIPTGRTDGGGGGGGNPGSTHIMFDIVDIGGGMGGASAGRAAHPVTL